jgi:hypothetical protein
MSVPSLGAARAARCAGCGTELAPALLSCPACHALVYRELLQALAVEATQRSARGDLVEAKATWQRALTLLPAGTQQHTDIGARMAALDARILEEARTKPPKPGSTGGPPWRRGLAGLGAVLLLMLGKLKFLLLGLSKASTLFSMLAFFGVYWTQFGWPLAAGLVVSIYIHEMGHVAALHRAGVPASAPLFIPGLGAIVRLRQHIQDASVNAMIGLAGRCGASAPRWRRGPPTWRPVSRCGAPSPISARISTCSTSSRSGSSTARAGWTRSTGGSAPSSWSSSRSPSR